MAGENCHIFLQNKIEFLRGVLIIESATYILACARFILLYVLETMLHCVNAYFTNFVVLYPVIQYVSIIPLHTARVKGGLTHSCEP